MSSLRFFYLTEGLQLFTLIPMAKYRLDCDIWEREKIIFAANSVHHVLCQTSPKFIRFHPIFSLWTIVLKQDFKQEVWAFYTRLQTIFGLRDEHESPIQSLCRICSPGPNLEGKTRSIPGAIGAPGLHLNASPQGLWSWLGLTVYMIRVIKKEVVNGKFIKVHGSEAWVFLLLMCSIFIWEIT